MKILGIDYGESRTGFAITDELNITVQGLETVYNNGSDKIILKKIDELLEKYEIDTISPDLFKIFFAFSVIWIVPIRCPVELSAQSKFPS